MAEKHNRSRSRSLSLDINAPKRRCPSHSSLDSDLDDQSWTSRTSDKKFTQASGWHRSDLEDVAVYFNDKNLSIAEMFSLVENRCNNQVSDLPELKKILIKSLKEGFKLSLPEFPDFSKKKLIYMEEWI